MKNDQASEEKLMKELDRMYLCVADLEKGRIATRVDNPDEYEQNSDERLATHEKVIPFPVHRTPVISGEPSEDRSRTKLWYRSYLMVSFPVIFLLFVTIIILVQLTIVPQDSEKKKSRQLTLPVQGERLTPVHREHPIQGVEKGGQGAKLLPDQPTRPGFPLTQKRHYTVQIGALKLEEQS